MVSFRWQFAWLVLFVACSPSSIATRSRLPNASQAESNPSENASDESKKDEKSETSTEENTTSEAAAAADGENVVVIPTEVSGAYLVCQQIAVIANSETDSKSYRGQFGCGMVSDQPDSSLSIKNKNSNTSKILVKNHFNFSIVTSSDRGLSVLESAPSSSSFDIIISISAETAADVLGAAQRTKVRVDYSDDAGKLVASLESFIPDAAAAEKSELIPVSKPPAPSETASLALRTPGVVYPVAPQKSCPQSIFPPLLWASRSKSSR